MDFKLPEWFGRKKKEEPQTESAPVEQPETKVIPEQQEDSEKENEQENMENTQ